MNLSQTVTIRGIEFKNRIVMPPMQVNVGINTTRARGYYSERAKGGVGTIIMAATPVDVFLTDATSIRSDTLDNLIAGLHPLMDDVHQVGVKIGIQLWHGNRLPAGSSAPEGPTGEMVAPSATDDERELTVAEIKTIISRFTEASVNARRAGFDFIEVHGAHGYLACQFFSPLRNRRSDEYGGNLTRRMRFGIECVSSIRSVVGDDYPIFYRLGAWEDIPGGITLDDSVPFAVELEKAGVDVLDVSMGATVGPGPTSSPGPEKPEGTFVHLAEAIKRRVKVPVIAVGRFRTPEFAEEVLAKGKADMVAIGRQLIADPYWSEKAITGRSEDIIPCISCNNCFQPIITGESLRCSVNVLAGRETELTAEPASRIKKVMVVGAGPAGMEAARVAALRGHHVTLYEKQNEPGGQLIPAAVPPCKDELASLNRYLAHQVEKNSVRVKPGVEVTAELVIKEKPDTIVLTTGSESLQPEIPGINKNNVVTAVDVLLGRVDVGERVVIIGGELVGCETADFLSRLDKKVTVVRRGPQMAAAMFISNRHALMSRLKEKGVTLITGIRQYQEITEEGLVLIDSEGKRQVLQADNIVLAAGATANNLLVKALEGKVGEIHLAGDCSQPGRIVDAIHQGARIGYEI